MNTSEIFLTKMANLQNSFLDYINNDFTDENFLLLLKSQIDSSAIVNCRNELKMFLHFLSQISKYYHETTFFFEKIGKILLFLKPNIEKTFSKFEIYNIFKGQKKIILFLHENNILTIDWSITNLMINSTNKKEYLKYFFLEVKDFIDDELADKISDELPENYEEQRKKNSDDDYIATLIQQDSIEQFIIYYNQKNFSLSKTKIKPSIFESNLLLTDKKLLFSKENSIITEKELTLIEYATLFGSVQICRFLFLNQVEFNSTLWIYAIHSNNPEIIHLLETNDVNLIDIDFCLQEAIKCHHNDIANYFINKNFPSLDEGYINSIRYAIKYYNFALINMNYINKSLFYDLCKYDYYPLVYELFKSVDCKEMQTRISIHISNIIYIYKLL